MSLGSADGDLASAETYNKATLSASVNSKCKLWSLSTGGTALALKILDVLVKNLEKITFAGRKLP